MIPTPPRILATVFAALVYPVPPTMLVMHALHARARRLGSPRVRVLVAAHALVWVALVGAVALGHGAWEASPGAPGAGVHAAGMAPAAGDGARSAEGALVARDAASDAARRGLVPDDAARAAGWALVALALGLVAASYRAIDARTASGIAQLEGSRRLVTRGIYAHVRHPRYAALVAGAVGDALLFGSAALWVGAAVTALGVAVLVRVEDAELERTFGTAWRRWRDATGALVPRVRRARHS